MIASLLLFSAMTAPQTPVVAIIPRPVMLTMESGTFTIDSKTDVEVGKGCNEVADRLRGYLSPGTGYEFPNGKDHQGQTIELSIDSHQKHGVEGYVLDVTPSKISIVGGGAAGVFYGVQTLRQLLPAQTFRKVPLDKGPYIIPCLHIVDYPRFSWRGTHLDCGRHFMPKSFILRFLDWMAMHKLNTFHWHLTEDQGWRLQIPQYPNLTGKGSWRKRSMITYSPPTYDNRAYGGYYTVEDAKEVVAFAKERFINVVPEIEMPGHSQAAVSAYPELGNTGKQVPVLDSWGVSADVINLKSSTVKFMENVLLEVMKIFPSKFIHLGGDEAPTTFWEKNPEMQAKMKKLGIKDPRGLQSWFTHQMDAFLTAHGRRMVGWDEILEGGKLAPGATVMSWRGEQGGIDAVKAGHDVVMTPGQYTYLDHYQSRDIDLEPNAIGGLLTLHQIYDYNPIPKEMTPEEATHVLGAQAQLWTEYMPDQLHVEYMAYPRLCAFSEVVWSPQKGKNFQDFMDRLKVHVHRLQALGINYRRLDPPEPILCTYSIENGKVSVETHNGVININKGQVSKSSSGSVLSLNIEKLVHAGQIVRIGIWAKDNTPSLDVIKVRLLIGAHAYKMKPSSRNPNAFSVRLGDTPEVAAGAERDVILQITFNPHKSKAFTGEIKLLPDPRDYHPYREGAR